MLSFYLPRFYVDSHVLQCNYGYIKEKNIHLLISDVFVRVSVVSFINDNVG